MVGLGGGFAALPRGRRVSEGRALGLDLEPLVGGAGGGRERWGPGPLGPGPAVVQRRRGRQLAGHGRQWAPDAGAALVAARAAGRARLCDVAGAAAAAAAALAAGHRDPTATSNQTDPGNALVHPVAFTEDCILLSQEICSVDFRRIDSRDADFLDKNLADLG